MPRLIPVALAITLTALLAGCSTYIADYHFEPVTLAAHTPTTLPSQPPPISVFAQVIGVHRRDSKEKIPLSLEVELHLKNNTRQPIAINPQSLNLNNESPVGFPSPLLRPQSDWTLAPNRAAIIHAFFAFPAGHSYSDTNLESLRLEVSITTGEQSFRDVFVSRRVDHPSYARFPYGPPDRSYDRLIPAVRRQASLVFPFI